MRFHLESGCCHEAVGQQQYRNDINQIDLVVNAQGHRKNGKRADAQHMQARLYFRKKQNQCQQRARDTARKKEKQFGNAVDSDALPQQDYH